VVTSDQGGSGLPPVAQARLADLAGHRTWGSTLGVPEFTAISKVGFEPVGQVLGAAVWNVGDRGDEECPYGMAVYRREGTPTGQSAMGLVRHVQAPQGAAAVGSARPLVSALYQARRAAVSRMTSECAALGGHGVIGVSLTVGPFAEDSLEFRAFGTAIRAPGARRPAVPFASDLSGQDFTKLVGYGWVPVGLAMGIAIGYRHDDWLVHGQTQATAGNVEVSGYTYLATQMRTDARNELQLDLVRMGAEGVVLREMETKISERKCPIVPFGKDHVVEATLLGTAITQFASFAPPPVYGIHDMAVRRPEPPPPPQISVSLEGESEPKAEPGAEQGDGERGQGERGEPRDQGQG
jgi:uncharacterized protein YbjQ (UPF0145 family)